MDILRKFEAEYGRNIPRELYNQRVMLQRVHDFWVNGVLEKSLRNEVLIKSGIREKRDVVTCQAEMSLQHSGQASRILEPDTKIIDIFDESQILLILGEPGSGKTTTLLELTRQAIVYAQTDPARRLPVVFNLSSWAKKQPPLREWLRQELNSLYQIPRKMAETWIETNAMVLFLDGLDEIAPEYRASCVQAIHFFRQNHPVPIAICGYIADYEMLSTKLSTPTSIILGPLKYTQVDSYLESLGSNYSLLRATVRKDRVLQKLTCTPLMLNLITLLFRGNTVPEPHSFDTEDECVVYLVDEFVKQMLSYRTRLTNESYSDEQVIGWLSHLAQKMARQRQSVFLVEQIQPNWLSTYLHLGIYAFGFRLLVLISVALLTWLLIGPLFALYFEHALGFYQIVFLGTIIVSIWMLFYYLDDNIKPIDPVTWRWKTAMNDLRLKVSLGFGLLLTPVCGLMYPAGFVLFLWVTWLGFFTLGGLSSTNIRLGAVYDDPLWPSTGNCIKIWLLFLIGYGGFFGLFLAILGVPITGVIAAIGTWLVIGLIGGLRFGGLAVIQHAILRLLLYFEKQTPFNYTRFLDYCEKCIFLRKVGGGYIFIHPLLLEYFSATLENIPFRKIEAQGNR